MKGFAKFKSMMIMANAKAVVVKDDYKQAMESENKNVKKAKNGINLIWIGLIIIALACIVPKFLQYIN